jgi:hypothetical protein
MLQSFARETMAKTPGWEEFYGELNDSLWDQLSQETQVLLIDDGLPEDVRRAACMIHPYPVGWLDNPIPNHNMKSARELMARKGGANKVRSILMDIAPAFLPDHDLFQQQNKTLE